MRSRRLALILGSIVLVLGGACTQDALEEFNDAPVAGNNDEPAIRISFPDGFGNVASKCDGPNRVYSTRNGDGGRAVAVVANDPRCL